jgi:GT2 family glycosyltransferase/Flp pilus assembly protein TadD
MPAPNLTSQPLVSIGMTVFNCERFLVEALESLLSQDYENFELIISDNASEDRTEEICREYQARDPRIQYSRNETDMGSLFNYTKVKNLSRGKYYMGATDHDLWHPTMISKCVEVLENDPEVIICYPRTQRIDVYGKFLFLGPSCFDTRGMSPAARYVHIINNIAGGEAAYGLLRLENYKRAVINPVWAADQSLLAALALDGAFAHLPEVLLSLRIIRDESMEGNRKHQAETLEPAKTMKMLTTDLVELWRQMGEECLAAVQRSSLSDLEKEILVAETIRCFSRRYGVKWLASPVVSELPKNDGHAGGQMPPTAIPAKKRGGEKQSAGQIRMAAEKRILEEATKGPRVSKGDWPLVSVIVPTFNRPDMLVATLQSILEQSYKNHEIIVVNDCGLDVADIVGWLNQQGNITYVRHDRNRGLAAARNTGLKLARGKYIAYLDDDDLYYPHHLQILVAFLETSGHQVAYTDALRAHQVKDQGRYVTTGRDLPYSHDFNGDHLLVANQFPVLCLMHEKSCLEKSGLFDETLTSHEDWDLWIRLSLHYPFFHIKRVTCEFSWRQDGSTMTSQKAADFIRTLEIIHAKYQEHLKDRPHLKAMQEQFLRQQKAALKKSPTEADAVARAQALLGMATAAMEREDWGTAEKHLRALIQNNPDLSEAYLSLSDILTLQGKHRDAWEVLRGALQADPEALPLLKRLGLNCRRRGDLSGAMAAFTKAWNRSPKDPEILGQLGATCIDLGLFQEAKSYLTDAAEIDPRHIEAWLGLGRVAQHLEDREAFDQACRRAAAINPQHPRLRELTKGRTPGNGEAAAPSSREVREEPDSKPARTLSSIIIPVFNNLSLTRQCLESIWDNTDVPHEIIVVDNGSTDGTRDYLYRLESEGEVRVISNRANLGFAKASNQGARAARGEYLVFLNNDTIVQPGWLSEMAACARKVDKIAAVGARLLYPDDTIQHAGVAFNDRKFASHIYNNYDRDHPAVLKEREFQAVTAACALVKKDLFFEVDGFDESYRNGFEDVDLCFKLRQRNYKVVYNPRAVVYHLESKTPGRHDRDIENSRLFKSKWDDKIIYDIDNYHQEDDIVVEILERHGNVDIIRAHDRNDNVFWGEAKKHRERGDLDQAEACYLRALRFNPFDPRKGLIAKEMADLYQTLGKHSEVEAMRRVVDTFLPRPGFRGISGEVQHFPRLP